MPVSIKGSGGGSVTLDASTAASDTTLTLPNTSGTILQSGTAVTAAQGGTGLTSVGTAGNVLTSNGTIWTSTAPATSGVNVQTFTGSGTWTKPAYAAGSRVLIQAWGGGGSGGRNSGGGGGGGGYNERWLTLSAMGATETVTIGAGGTGVTTNVNGNNGGNTTVGSLITAYGGGGGGGNNSPQGGGGGGQLSAGTRGGTTSTVLGGKPWGISFATSGCTTVQIATPGSGGGWLSSQPTGFPTTATGVDGFIHGGGGASGGSSPGGASVWGGGGGGGDDSTSAGAGGASSYGGNGGAGGAGATSGTAGSQPGGGGGGTRSGATSGAGGAGQVIITVFPA